MMSGSSTVEVRVILHDVSTQKDREVTIKDFVRLGESTDTKVEKVAAEAVDTLFDMPKYTVQIRKDRTA